jgi:hypothetical protein
LRIAAGSGTTAMMPLGVSTVASSPNSASESSVLVFAAPRHSRYLAISGRPAPLSLTRISSGMPQWRP